MRRAVEHAIAAGELLIEAKKQVKHGEWQIWLMANCDISERTVQAYMRLARTPLEKRNAVADLPLREALASLAKPKIRYVFDDCGHPASCNCGVDYVLKDDRGKVVVRKPVRPVDDDVEYHKAEFIRLFQKSQAAREELNAFLKAHPELPVDQTTSDMIEFWEDGPDRGHC
jgi:hypothetical protein